MATRAPIQDATDAKEVTPAQRVRNLHDDHIGIWNPYWDAMAREKAFLEGDRYEIDHGIEQRDRRLTQIRGQETQDTVRHVVAEMTSRPRSVEARAIDTDTDPDAAEIEVALVETELSNPWKGFESRRYEALQAACEKRLGLVWMDWDPSVGPYGEILYSFQSGDRVLWDPAYDPHHPLCGWMIVMKRMPVPWIHANYPKTKSWLKADQERASEKERARDGVPFVRDGDGHTLNPEPGVRDNKAELWFCYYKNDHTNYQRETGRDLDLEPDQRYLACENGCGYRSPAEYELREQGKLETELPEQIEGGCPDCAAQGRIGNLERIDSLAEEETVLSYSRGKRLTIIAPFNRGPEDEPVYDGKWPIPKARSFPCYLAMRYVDPGKVMGPSDVKLMWDQQAASDNLRTMSLQRVFEHRNYWILPAVGIEDYRRQRFNFREDQYNVMYRDMTKTEFGNLEVEVKSGSGLDATGWNLAFQACQAALTQYRPAVDLGLTPESSKNIAGVTIEQLVQQGNVPIADFKRRDNLELGKFYGVVSDYIHATYTPKRLARLRIDGIDLAVRMWGQDQPNYDFVIEESPAFTGLEKQRSEAFTAMLQVIQQAQQTGIPADVLIELWAKVNNIPRSIVRDFRKAIELAKDEMAQQEPAADTGDGLGMTPGLEGGSTPAAADEGLEGVGMEPAFEA